MRRLAASLRIATVLLGSAFCLLPNLGGLDRNYPVAVDASWMMGLTDAWRHGEVSGRDLYSTYGLLFQLLGGLSDRLHQPPGSPFDSVLLFGLVLNAVSLLAFGGVLLALGRLSPKGIAALYGAFLLLSVYQPVLVRLLVALLAALWAARGLESASPRRRRLAAVGAGVVAMAAQLLSFEVGPYAILTVAGVAALLALLAWRGFRPAQGELLPPRAYLETAALAAGTYAALNVLLALLFWASGPAGLGFFDYHRAMLAISGGYSYAQALPWVMAPVPTAVWLAVLLYTGGFLVVMRRRFAAADLPVLATLALFSLLLLKSAVVRADLGHIALGSAPALLLFLLLGRDWVGRRRAPVLWAVLLALLVTSWPFTSFHKLQAWIPLVERTAHPGRELAELRSFAGARLLPRPPALAAADPHRRLMVFPYQNYWALVSGHRQFAPIIQLYQANRRRLEQLYVERMERHRDEFQILYSFDGLTAHQFEDVQQVTRNPLVFEHIARAYQPVAGQPDDPGYLLLEPRAMPRELPIRSLPFRRQAAAGYDQVTLDQPASCALVKLALELDYPFLMPLGRAAQIEVEVHAGDRVVLRRGLFAIEGQKEFDTYLSLIEPERFREIWTGPPGVPGKVFDRITFHPRDGTLFAFRPNSVTVKNVACVNP